MYKYTNKWMLFIRQNHQDRIVNKISILHIYFTCVIWDRQVNWCPLGCFSYNKMKQNETWFEHCKFTYFWEKIKFGKFLYNSCLSFSFSKMSFFYYSQASENDLIKQFGNSGMKKVESKC